MPMPPSNPAPSSSPRKPILGLSPRAWWYVAIAFAAGIALFVLLWAKQRNDDDFYRVDGARQSNTGQPFEPLPGPDLDAAGKAGEHAAAPDDATGNARIVETAPPPAPPTAPLLQQPTTPAGSPVATSSAADTLPVLISSPPPAYPREALRRGESGETLLRVHVGADGVPYAIDLVRSSGSRSLDRAATDAARKWRFNPARRGGQAIAGTVQVPISFSPSR